MLLYDEIIAVYPDLTAEDFGIDKAILLRDDSDGQGAYIAKWEHTHPLPEGFKIGK
jgi:hypothetical protein